MDTRDHPHAASPGNGHDKTALNPRCPDRSRLERLLTKGSIWKKQALGKIDTSGESLDTDTSDPESRTVELAFRLSAQLDERNEEIERLRQAVSKLENENSRLDREHRRQVERHRSELESLQDAYSQFEMESDRLLSQLDQQNERLLNECRHSNVRSLLND